MRFLGGGGSFYLRICRGGGSIVPLGYGGQRGNFIGGGGSLYHCVTCGGGGV